MVKIVGLLNHKQHTLPKLHVKYFTEDAKVNTLLKFFYNSYSMCSMLFLIACFLEMFPWN